MTSSADINPRPPSFLREKNFQRSIRTLASKIVEKDEDGYFVVSVPTLPGCHTQGKTLETATKRIKEAIELSLII